MIIPENSKEVIQEMPTNSKNTRSTLKQVIDISYQIIDNTLHNRKPQQKTGLRLLYFYFVLTLILKYAMRN